MRVQRNFEQLYAAEVDPWNIGAADSPRYAHYRELIRRYAAGRESILDIGCGLGAFLAHFYGEFRRLHGVDVSANAIQRARSLHPGAEFTQSDANHLSTRVTESYDVIVCSDMVYYLAERERRQLIRWIADHLTEQGIAFVAAWVPGGRYLRVDELRRLVQMELAIKHEELLPSDHAVFVLARKQRLIAITVDYETWQPIPVGRTIDWDRDVFNPTARLLDVADRNGVPLTLMVELAEYFWLRENEPTLADRMERQWIDARKRGHDVQLHLHPNWLPALGARRNGATWWWDETRPRAHDYPGDLTALIAECKAALERVLRGVDANYRVTCFRAGGYRAQPFHRLYDALAANGILCDSSVVPGRQSAERRIDYTLAWARYTAYFAARVDPQLRAPPAEERIVELPILSFRSGETWSLDSSEGCRFASRLIDYVSRRERGTPSAERFRLGNSGRQLFSVGYEALTALRLIVNRVLPRRLIYLASAPYPPESRVNHEYYVAIGHSKNDLDIEAIGHGFAQLKRNGRFEFVTLSQMADTARAELQSSGRRDPVEEARYQVARETGAVLGEQRNFAQSARLQSLIPFDRSRVLDLGCGAGYWTERISRLHPWMLVTGVDVGEQFIATAHARHHSDRVAFARGDLAALPFHTGSFDCIYADNVLEHAYDVDASIREVHRVLRVGGVLLAALPSDARNPSRVCDNHTWKTAPHDVRMRLEAAGFTAVEIDEVDTLRRLGMPPYPPSLDRMMYIRAWKRDRPASPLERALEAMQWVYDVLEPGPTPDLPAREIIARGQSLCWGYSVVLGEILRAEGYDVSWITMLARDHPHGTGEDRVDSHEVLQVRAGSRTVLLDPTTNTCVPGSLPEILANPSLATGPRTLDARYVARDYASYATSFFYERVFRYAVRRSPVGPIRRWQWRRVK